MSHRVAITAYVALLAVSGVLQAATSYNCSYESYSDSSGVHKVTEPFELAFLVDKSANKAYVTGKIGTEEVELVPNFGGVTLVETTLSGNVMVTAILNSGVSVHSRTTVIGKEIVASQYFGKCTKK